MTTYIEDYVNWFPTGYAVFALWVFIGCAIVFAQSWGDYRMFGSKFYLRRMWRAFIGAIFSAFIFWPVPVIAWIIFNLPHWIARRSEFDEVELYEANRS